VLPSDGGRPVTKWGDEAQGEAEGDQPMRVLVLAAGGTCIDISPGSTTRTAVEGRTRSSGFPDGRSI